MQAYQDAIDQCLAQSRKIIKQYFRQDVDVENKLDSSPVTIADKKTEMAIREILKKTFPSHAILGEEFDDYLGDSNGQYSWSIDPIDGTKSFVSGSPLFGTLIALNYHDSPILGVIDMPILGEKWFAQANTQGQGGIKGTFLNGVQCRTSNDTELSEAILYATEPNIFSDEEYQQFNHLALSTRMRRFGGDCYNYGLLASGHIHLVVEASLKYYDIMALIPIVEQAGGVITDWQGNDLDKQILADQFSGQVIASANNELHIKALEKLNDKNIL